MTEESQLAQIVRGQMPAELFLPEIYRFFGEVDVLNESDTIRDIGRTGDVIRFERSIVYRRKVMVPGRENYCRIKLKYEVTKEGDIIGTFK